MHARLPQALVMTNTLEQLEPGQRAYIVPWAMSADEHGFLWLNSKYQYFSAPDGTAQMEVYRTNDGDYLVIVPPGQTYERQPRDNSCRFGIPVAEVRH